MELLPRSKLSTFRFWILTTKTIFQVNPDAQSTETNSKAVPEKVDETLL